MKCIVDNNGKISRVSDEIAQYRVEQGTHRYSCKQAWKSQVRNPAKAEKSQPEAAPVPVA